MKPTNSAEIRQAFLDFFAEMGHEVVPSSPLPLVDNPTLLFANAGMNQFVDVFLGKEKRPYKRAATSQKCMRVQGKHNDLENVGPSPRHHTFFEMLGNFSFGDYFKEKAIRYAYDFLVTVCQLPTDRLWYTVLSDDEEAYRIWLDEIGVPAERVLRMGEETNFWMMGDVGPCGPTSEVHYDWGPDYCTCDEPDCSVLLDNDCDRWLELWNLVFMQYNQDEDGTRTPLPRPGVDTGLGLERLTSVMEDQPVNYNTDLFLPAMQRLQELLGDEDAQRQDKLIAYRVIADHGRAATFLLADGVLPGNVGPGYVLRMIIRRAARYGRLNGLADPFLAEIAEVYIEKMGGFYQELRDQREHIVHTVTLEEERFAMTLDAALAQLDLFLSGLRSESVSEVPGEKAFDLYATHGLPLEITRDVAAEQGFTVDEAGFEQARDAHARASGAGAFGRYDTDGGVYDHLLNDLVEHGRLEMSGVDYDPYIGATMESEIIAIVVDGQVVDSIEAGQEAEVVTAATPFYVEAGGEVSDTGHIMTGNGSEFAVKDVSRPANGLIAHIGYVSRGSMSPGQPARLVVDDQRRWDIRRNHTATHLLHRELRANLGGHVTQQGSLVAPDRLRFDFSHGEAVDPDKLAVIERAINEAILANYAVKAEHMSLTSAKSAGAMALFGEKYGEVVRTIRIGEQDEPYSFELCGGLHVSATGDIGLFRFTSEGAIGAGLRRVEAVTGHGALELVGGRLDTLERVADMLNSPIGDVESRVEGLLEEQRKLEREITVLRRERAMSQFLAALEKRQIVKDVQLVAVQVDAPDVETLREMADWFRDRVEYGVAVFGAVKDGRPILIAAVTENLTKQGVKAGELVGKVARLVGGGGGGRPTLAQAGGKYPEKLPDALGAVPEVLREILDSRQE